MNVVSLVILLVSAVVVAAAAAVEVDVAAGAAAAAPLDTAGALAMVAGVTVRVGGHRHAGVCHHLVRQTTAGHHRIVDVMKCHTQTEMGLRIGVVAGADCYVKGGLRR